MPWTRFMDRHSGGGCKEDPYDKIYIEAPESEAIVIFYNRFGHNPNRVTCTCCGEDYSISESNTLEEASGYDRNCAYAYFFLDDGTEAPARKDAAYNREMHRWEIDGRPVEDRIVERLRKPAYGQKYIPLEEYVTFPTVLVIHADEISKRERTGDVPEQGYVWAG